MKLSLFVSLIFAFQFIVAPARSATETAPRANTETYRDIIEKAHNLSLQKERAHAVQLLNSSITRESKKGPAPKELILALEEVSSLFMSDKAQQQFELALSLRANEPQLAQQKLADAAKIEPDNLQIQLEQFRVATILGGCSEAAASVLKLYETLSALEIVRLAAAQALMCQGQVEEAVKTKGIVDPKKTTLLIFWQLLDVEALQRTGKIEKGLEILAQIEKTSPAFPEAYYWKWRLDRDLKKVTEKPAQKYVSLCKSLSPRAYRKYLAEPFLCRRLQEVESSLKKNNTPTS